MTDSSKSFSRRHLMTGVTALGLSTIATPRKSVQAETVAEITHPSHSEIISQRKGYANTIAANGDYDEVELIKPAIYLSVVQSRIRAIDIHPIQSTRQANLNHLLELIDAANNWGGPKDLLLFY